MLPQYNSQPDVSVKSVWLQNTTGADITLSVGQAVAYDMDDTAAPVVNTDVKNSRGRRVVKPATAVLGAFAGLIAPTSAGKVIVNATGAFVDIVVPRSGDVCLANVKANATKGATVLGITNAGGFSLVAMTDATFNVDVAAIALETADTSTTAAAKLVKFL